uniref:Uncharacterized protein n=1 Tax=Solibacter usitatus (strain Ellin6076) TaxID=234267 RepID=Q028P7_SOLUE
MISVQIAWFPGWKATIGGRAIPVVPDGIGFVVLRPDCQGECEVTLIWSGRADYMISAIVSLIALGITAVMLWRRSTNRDRKEA